MTFGPDYWNEVARCAREIERMERERETPPEPIELTAPRSIVLQNIPFRPINLKPGWK